MHRTRIKICGVRDAATAEQAADAGADAIGLVFVEGSPRRVTLSQAAEVIAALPALVEPVGLFVDEPIAHIRQVCVELGLRTVQLHGRETPEDVAALAPIRVIKALAFESRQVSALLAPWRSAGTNLAAILWDAPPPDKTTDPAQRGGSGRTFNWDDLATLAHAGVLAAMPPTILAGGLTPRNVGRAIATLRPYAVDVSSGVESARGVKDAVLIQAFCAAVRQADQSSPRRSEAASA